MDFERCEMAVSYKKLWKLLIDKDMKKIELEAKAGVSHDTMKRITKCENVTVDTLGKICRVLNCKIEDIIEFVND